MTFCKTIIMKACFKLTYTMILMEMVKYSQSSQIASFAMPLQYLRKDVRDEVDFLHADKHQSFLQVDFNTLGIKDFYKVILSLLMAWSSMFKVLKVTSLQYLYNIWEKKLGIEFIFCMQININFYKLALLFLMEVARHVQSTQNRKLVKFLQYIKKNVLQRLLCSIVMQNIQLLYGVSVMFIATCFWVVVVKYGCETPVLF